MRKAKDYTLAALVAPHRLERYREMVDCEIVMVSIHHCISRRDAAMRIASEFGYRLEWASGTEGLIIACDVCENDSEDNATAIQVCAFDLSDALVAVLCLLLDGRCEVFYASDSERRRYLPERLVAATKIIEDRRSCAQLGRVAEQIRLPALQAAAKAVARNEKMMRRVAEQIRLPALQAAAETARF